jgi:hypothetical protein
LVELSGFRHFLGAFIEGKVFYQYSSLRLLKRWRVCHFNQLPGADRAQAQKEREENADRHID